jgi:ketosteroid isomerase-like protein
MSAEHADVIRRLFDAWNRDDRDALVAELSPDVAWEENPEFPGLREVYRGPEEVREWAGEILEPWESSHAELGELTELSDERMLAEAVITGRGKGAGVPVELRFWLIVSFAGAKVDRRQVFWARDEAREAAGLSE